MSDVKICPVCSGKGLVPNGFYTPLSSYWLWTSTMPEICRSCGGTGYIVIGATENTPPVKLLELETVWAAEWIKVGDSLPPPGEEVLVTVIDHDNEFRYNTVGWYTGWEDKWVVDNELTALVEWWAEKPEPKED